MEVDNESMEFDVWNMVKSIPIEVASRVDSIHLDDQPKTTFTCPYGTFAFRHMPFGFCNAPATFQQCMYSIFSNFA